MASVIIERLPWADFIARYDRAGTLFYLDPPYFGSERDYGRAMFDRGQFEIMADHLSTLKGRFILSINDHPEVRRIFAAFSMQTADLTYTIAGKGGTAARELIITN
jgi:DNA adenine methylase